MISWQEIFKRNLDLIINYNPNQPRDKDGKWTKTGFGASYDKDLKGWKDSNGIPLPVESQTRLRSMKTPPAWTNVKLNPDPKAGLQVVGTDAKGRQQPIYTTEHHNQKSAKKFERIKRLNGKMDGIIEGSRKGMLNSSLSSSEQDSSAALYIITQTGARPGSNRDRGGTKKAYGVTTLEGRHVKIKGDQINLNFTGKKGVRQDITFSDKSLAGYLKSKQVGANEKVFPSTSLRKALDSVGGKGFMAKDIRTWKGTVTALQEVKKFPKPKTKKDFKKYVKEVATKVSSKLGNTPAVALKSYIAPHVFHTWEAALNL